MAAKYRVSVNLSEEEYQMLSGMADKYRVSMAWLSRQAITGYLERSEHEVLQLPLGLTVAERQEHHSEN